MQSFMAVNILRMDIITEVQPVGNKLQHPTIKLFLWSEGPYIRHTLWLIIWIKLKIRQSLTMNDRMSKI